MKKTKIIALAMCALIMASVFAGCSSKPAVMKINGVSIPQGVYTYFYVYLASNFGSQLSEDQMKEMTVEQLKQYVAVGEIAKEQKITVTSEENKAIIDSINTQKKDNGTGYANTLKALGLSESQYIELMKNSTLSSKIASYYYGDKGISKPTSEELRQNYIDNYVHVTHILLSTENAADDAARAKVKAKAEEVLVKAKAGDDFVDLVKLYGEDPGVKEAPEVGYYFTTGQMMAPFETASFALADNEISELVETSAGYHIIKRLPITDEYLTTMETDEEYYSNYCTKLLSDMFTTKTASYEVVKLDAFEKMDLAAVIAAMSSGS